MTMPTAEALRAAFGLEWAFRLILVAGILGIVTTINACVICLTRALLAASHAGFVSPWFAQVTERRQIPRNALLAVAVPTVVGPFLKLEWLATDLGPISFIAAFALTCVAAVKVTRDRKSATGLAVSRFGLFVSIAMAVSMLIPGAYYYLEWPNGYLFLAVSAAIGYVVYRARYRLASG